MVGNSGPLHCDDVVNGGKVGRTVTEAVGGQDEFPLRAALLLSWCLGLALRGFIGIEAFLSAVGAIDKGLHLHWQSEFLK